MNTCLKYPISRNIGANILDNEFTWNRLRSRESSSSLLLVERLRVCVRICVGEKEWFFLSKKKEATEPYPPRNFSSNAKKIRNIWRFWGFNCTRFGIFVQLFEAAMWQQALDVGRSWIDTRESRVGIWYFATSSSAHFGYIFFHHFATSSNMLFRANFGRTKSLCFKQTYWLIRLTAHKWWMSFNWIWSFRSNVSLSRAECASYNLMRLHNVTIRDELKSKRESFMCSRHTSRGEEGSEPIQTTTQKIPWSWNIEMLCLEVWAEPREVEEERKEIKK